MKVLIIDNYDSFTYNLVHYIEQFASEVLVIQNNEEYKEHVKWADKLILSPGPGLPEESGSLMEIISFAVGKLPILGVCLAVLALKVITKGSPRNDPWGSLHERIHHPQ